MVNPGTASNGGEDKRASPISPAHEVPNPVVTEARRLLITRDVMIGDGLREYCFADNVPVHNVWHTLWRTQPVREYSVNRLNHFFQIDPDSPLAVFLWQINIAMEEDLPNQGFEVATLQSRRARAWAVRTDAGALRAGQWDQPEQAAEPVSSRFGLNSYAAFLDSPLGGAALFPLTDGLIMRTSLPKRGDVQVIVPAETAPQRKGEAKQVNLLILGVPRRCALTENWPASKEVVERFYRDFALDGGKGGYAARLDQGAVLSRRYVLSIDGTPSGGMSGQLEGKLISSLPIAVSGLNDRWSAFLYDRQLKKSPPRRRAGGQGLGRRQPGRPGRSFRRPSRPGRPPGAVRAIDTIRQGEMDLGDPQPDRRANHHTHPCSPRL